MIKNRKKVIIFIQFLLSIFLNILRNSEFMQIFGDVTFQLLASAFGGLLLSYLVQFYKKGQWLKYWIGVYFFILFFDLIDVLGVLQY